MTDKAVETKVREVKDAEGNVVERITELWVEKRPMELKSRVVEKLSVAPVVLEKFVETFEDGNVVDTHAETSVTNVSVSDASAKKYVSAAPKTKEKFKGLADMQSRVENDTLKKVANYGFYVILIALLAVITYKVM